MCSNNPTDSCRFKGASSLIPESSLPSNTLPFSVLAIFQKQCNISAVDLKNCNVKGIQDILLVFIFNSFRQLILFLYCYSVVMDQNKARPSYGWPWRKESLGHALFKVSMYDMLMKQKFEMWMGFEEFTQHKRLDAHSLSESSVSLHRCVKCGPKLKLTLKVKIGGLFFLTAIHLCSTYSRWEKKCFSWDCEETCSKHHHLSLLDM